MSPYYEDATVAIHHGDCLDVLRELPDASVDAVVTDPPYGLGFMGKEWDKIKQEASRPPSADVIDERFNHKFPRTGKGPAATAFDGVGFQAWCLKWTAECLRVLKPGGHMLAFGGMRTQHRMACAVEDAGFEIRDSISWIFGSGFPKSLNVTNALNQTVPPDAHCVCGQRSTQTPPGSPGGYPSSHGSDDAQPRREVAGDLEPAPSPGGARAHTRGDLPADGQAAARANSASDEASARLSSVSSPRLVGHLSAGSPASESAPSGTPSSTSPRADSGNDRTRDRTQDRSGSAAGSASSSSWRNKHMTCSECGGFAAPKGLGTALKPATELIVVARKPLGAGTVAANVLAHGTGALNVDGCRVDSGGEAWTHGGGPRSGTRRGGIMGEVVGSPASEGNTAGRWPANVVLDESQAASLDAQSGELHGAGSARESIRECDPTGMFGLAGDGNRLGDAGGASRFFYTAKAASSERVKLDGTAHPTVKPLALMRWLVRLVTPPGGTVLEPFAGSGTTVEACILEGFACIAIEREADYLPLIRQRIHRRRDPVEAVRGSGEDAGLFDLFGEDTP